MKPILMAFVLALSASPGLAVGFDTGSLTPVLTFPEPSPEPVTQDRVSIKK